MHSRKISQPRTRFQRPRVTALALAGALVLATSCYPPHEKKSPGEPAGSSRGLPPLVNNGPTTGASGQDAGLAPDASRTGERDVSVAPPPEGDLPPAPPPPPPPTSTAVLTFRNDTFRTGAQLLERQLDVAKVRARGMVVKFTNDILGELNAQPLYVPGLTVNGVRRDVVFVATISNTVYAFDANERYPDHESSTKLWQTSLVDPENPTVRPLPRGIYSTPVIDLATNTMYLVHSTRNVRRDTGKLSPDETARLDVAFFLVALDIRDGKLLRTTKLEGSYPGSGGTAVPFEARNHWCRPALLLSRGSLYVACGMRQHELTTQFRGWVFRHDAATFARQGVFCTAPNVTTPGQGASIWQSGGGLAEDPEGNVYFITGNGPADFGNQSYGNALVKLSTQNGTLALAGAFSPEGPEGKLAENDVDFGSGGALVLPDAAYVLGAGKTGIGYLLDRATMKKRQEFPAAINQYDPTAPVDADWEGGPHVHGVATYWRAPTAGLAYVYTWGEQDYLRRHVLDLATGRFDPAKLVTGKVLGHPHTMPGGVHTLSADGNRSGTGILWATLPAFAGNIPTEGGRLMAYDAETLELLWETSFSTLPKWMPPTIADGKLFLGTSSGKLLIYELGPPRP
jgi:outer membrane protein assembly factor BamB